MARRARSRAASPSGPAQLVERLEKGEAIEAVAAEAGVDGARPRPTSPARTSQGRALGRGRQPHLRASRSARPASAEAGDGSRVVFKVTAATVPPFVDHHAGGAAHRGPAARRRSGDDLVGEYVAQAQTGSRRHRSTSRPCAAARRRRALTAAVLAEPGFEAFAARLRGRARPASSAATLVGDSRRRSRPS